jgi:hypothetical protein
MAEAYVEYALRKPHEYELFNSHARWLTPTKGPGRALPIRQSRPNFALTEERLGARLGGSRDDHTRLALALWALVHGTASMLLSQVIPEGHEAEMRSACRAAVKALLVGSDSFARRKRTRRR